MLSTVVVYHLSPQKPYKVNTYINSPNFIDEERDLKRGFAHGHIGVCSWLLKQKSCQSSYSVQLSSVQLLSCVQLFATPWIAARQASLSITNSRSLLKLMSIELVMPYSHLILCHPLLLLPPTPPSIRVFSNESTLHMRWPKYWSFSFSKLILHGPKPPSI